MRMTRDARVRSLLFLKDSPPLEKRATYSSKTSG